MRDDELIVRNASPNDPTVLGVLADFYEEEGRPRSVVDRLRDSASKMKPSIESYQDVLFWTKQDVYKGMPYFSVARAVQLLATELFEVVGGIGFVYFEHNSVNDYSVVDVLVCDEYGRERARYWLRSNPTDIQTALLQAAKPPADSSELWSVESFNRFITQLRVNRRR